MHVSIASQARQQQSDDAHENNVLQFLLGTAPLSNKSTPRSDGTQATGLFAIVGPTGKSPSLLTSALDAEGGATDSDLLDVPLLEYGSDCESEDDYIALEPVAGFQDGRLEEKITTNLSAESGAVESGENQSEGSNECDQAGQDLDVLSALKDEPETQSETAGEKDLALESLTIRGDNDGDTVEEPVDCISDTSSTCTDADARSSDSEGASELLEVEEKPSERPESAAVGEKENGVFGDEKEMSRVDPAQCSPVSIHSNKSSPSSKHPISSKRAHDTEKPHDATNKFDTKNDEKRECEQATQQEGEKPSDSKETQQDSVCASTTENDDSEASQQSSSDDESPHPESLEKTSPNDSLQANRTPSEIALVSVVAIGILIYVVATIYAYFHPIFLPLPPLASLQTPVDLTNASVAIASSVNHSIVQQPLLFEWTLVDYPVEAISVYGPEAFQYRVSVNSKLVISEIGLLSTSTSSSNFGGDQTDSMSSSKATFNTTIRHRIPKQYLPDYGRYELLLQVKLPIPGSEDDAVHIVEERVFVTKAVEVGRKLELISPEDGTVVASGESVVVEYRAANVKRLDIVIDGNWIIHKQQIDDGSLLLRGLAAGQHTIGLVGFDASGKEILNTEESRSMTTVEILSS